MQFMHESDILIGIQVEVSASWIIVNSYGFQRITRVPIIRIIIRVKSTGRRLLECCANDLVVAMLFAAYRMDNFIVALTNNPPSTTSPPTSNYAKCGQWPGAVPGGQTLFVRCADNLPAARYVAILGQIPGDVVQVCEVVVYGKGMHIMPTALIIS